MANKFKRYFIFRKNDRIGFISLLSLVTLIFVTTLLYPIVFKKNKVSDYQKFSAQIDTFINTLEKKPDEDFISRLDSVIIAKYEKLSLFTFNPNTTTDEEWVKLGLTDKQIEEVVAYKKRGGKFIIKDDFRKIYGIRTKQYQILEPYIDLPDNYPQQNYYQNNYRNFYNNNNNNQNKGTYTLFEFDPNTATESDFEKLGLSEYQIKIIKNYREKGGVYYKKEDFQKTYSITPDDYKRLEPYIKISVSNNQQVVVKNTANIGLVEINSADTNLFKQLPGIGSATAKKIVNYREKLGGFYAIEQIKEVYGIKPETYQKIEQNLTVDKSKVKTININFAEYQDLSKHPYIDSKTANSIINYRKKNGFYSSLNQLIDNNILTKEQFEKLKNYLVVE